MCEVLEMLRLLTMYVYENLEIFSQFSLHVCMLYVLNFKILHMSVRACIRA